MQGVYVSAFGFPLGVLAGMTVCSFAARWLRLVQISTAKHGGDFLGPPRRRLIAMLPIATLLHPGAWVSLAALIYTVRILMRGYDPFWSWVVVGFYSVVALLAYSMYIAKARAKKTGSTSVGERT